MRKIILTWLALCVALVGAWQLPALDIPHFKSAHIERLLVTPAHAQLSLTGAGAGGPSSASWTPSTPGNLLYLWRADQGVTSSSGNVSAWLDQASGLSLAAGGGDPTITSSVFGSQPAITCSGTTQNLTQTSGVSMPSGSAYSVMILFTSSSSQTGGQGLFSYASSVGSGGNDYQNPGFVFDFNTGPDIEIYSTGDIGGANVSWSTNTPTVVGFTTNGTTGEVYENFSSTSSASFTSSLGYASGNELSVCSRIGGSANYGTVQIGYIAVYTKTLAGTDLTNFKNWTNSNWGTSF
jgi:hypothetical protein